MDREEFEDAYRQFQEEMKQWKELERALWELINTTSLLLAKMLMKFTEKDRAKSIKEKDERQLKGIYIVSLENEYFEVCQAIKEELESRGIKTP